MGKRSKLLRYEKVSDEIKTLLKEPGRIGLQAENPNYETRYFQTNDVEVQGRLTGLIRKY